MIEQVKKRTGEIVPFDPERIKIAIQKAFESINQEPKDLDAIVTLIIKDVEKKVSETPSVEDISDATEMILMQKHPAVAKSYILFREYKRQLRDIRKVYIGSAEKSNLTLNAIKVLEARYLLKDNQGNIIETPNQLFDRVAEHIARADKKRLSPKKQKQLQDNFYDLMYYLDFLPNTPTLMNAGTDLGQLSACFVLPVGDSISEIFDSVKHTALIHQSGGGTGFSFARLRPKGSFVKSTKGVASGPISFMRVFDAATDVIKQGGKRRGANMGILRVDHPDILEFISCKQVEGQIANFNISVAVTETFMNAVENNQEYDLIDPHNGDIVGKLNARSVFDLIANMAWQNGEPGIIFIDEMNRHNQVANMGTIEATNPCHRGTNMIHTDMGLLPIKELVNKKFNVLCPDGKKEHAQAFSTGKQKLFRIKLDNGLHIDLTKNHNLISDKNEKIEVKDMKKGTKIALSQYSINPTKSEYSFLEKDGFVLGWNYGDGWITWHSNEKVKNWQIGFVFGNEDKDIYSYIKQYFKKLGINIIGSDRLKTKGVIELTTTHKIARDLFLGKFKAISKKDGIPITVLRGNREYQKGFLNGLFSSDGNVHGETNGQKRIRRITLTSAHSKLIEDVQILLSTFGIISRVRQSKSKLNNKEYIRFDLTISGENIKLFAKLIGFKNKNKQKKLNGLVNTKWKDTKQINFAKVVEVIDLKKTEEVYNLTVFNNDHKFAVNGIISANCGEQALLPYESCNLGSINLANMVDENGNIDWKKLEETIRLAVRFLDNVIDMNKYPLPQIESMTKSSRKIGLGVMGWADMLLQLKIPYNSDEAVYLAEKVMKFINDIGVDTSVKLGEEKGNFPAFKGSYWDVIGYKYMRNSTITTIAPTGTISMIADASGGIEPQFSLAYTRLTLDNQEFIYTNKYLENELKRRGIYTEELMIKIAKTGMLSDIDGLPDDIKRVYVTSREIDTEWHIKMQAAFQKYTHNAVSKTINMPNSASIDDVKKAYKMAYDLKCKGLTIYRDASRQIQILTAGTKTKSVEQPQEHEAKKPMLQKLITKEIPKDECPICHTKMQAQEGCYTCTKCAYSKCS